MKLRGKGALTMMALDMSRLWGFEREMTVKVRMFDAMQIIMLVPKHTTRRERENQDAASLTSANPRTMS